MLKRTIQRENGSVEDGFKQAVRVIEGEYEYPTQSHASMGPACALVEIKDGQATVWSGTQKSHFVQQGVAATIGLPVENVRRRTKADLPENDTRPDIRVDADTFTVTIDGEIVEPQPVEELPLAQRYFLF